MVQAATISSLLEGSSPEELIPPSYVEEQKDAVFSSPPTSPETVSPDAQIETDQSEQAGRIDYHNGFELEEEYSGEPLDFSRMETEKSEHTGAGFETNSTNSEGSYGNYITYSCLLIPRIPEHMLNGNLASYLFKWMGQLCLAYGWRLEHLSIHSNHIQW